MSLLYAYSALPPLDYNQIPPISLSRFYDILDLNLGEKDKESLVSLRRRVDIKNILSFQVGVPFNEKGNFLEAGLALALSNAEYLPEYILNFLEENPDEKDLIKNFPQLYALLFLKKRLLVEEFLQNF